MKFFGKRGKAGSSATITSRMARYLENRQRKLADYLNGKTVHVPKTTILYALVVFCTVFGGYLLYLIANAIGAFN